MCIIREYDDINLMPLNGLWHLVTLVLENQVVYQCWQLEEASCATQRCNPTVWHGKRNPPPLRACHLDGDEIHSEKPALVGAACTRYSWQLVRTWVDAMLCNLSTKTLDVNRYGPTLGHGCINKHRHSI